jgi:hypothetical protein
MDQASIQLRNVRSAGSPLRPWGTYSQPNITILGSLDELNTAVYVLGSMLRAGRLDLKCIARCWVQSCHDHCHDIHLLTGNFEV